MLVTMKQAIMDLTPVAGLKLETYAILMKMVSFTLLID